MARLALWVVNMLFFAVSAVEFTMPPSSLISGVTAGAPFNITWTDAIGDVMLLLIDATSNITVSFIQSGLAGVSWYIWTPATSLPSHVYRLEIGDNTVTPSYSDLFSLVSGGLPVSSQQLPSTSPSSISSMTTSQTWTRSHYYSGSATASPSATDQPPLPPACSASCSRNLNGTRVTHTPNAADAAPTSSVSVSTSTKSIAKSTQHTGLSNSAKAAVGIGAALGGNILIALAILTFWRGKRAARSRKGSADNFTMHGALGEKVEAVEMDAAAPNNRPEADGRRGNIAQSENG